MSTKPHDALVRETFEHPENARGELQHLLPAALSARIDWSTLALVPGNFVDEALAESESDLLFKVQLDGRDTYLYLLFEHQSTADPWMPFRQLKYEVRFWEDWLEDHPDATRLPVVIPLLLCHAPSGWSVATRFEDLLDIDGEARELVLDFVPRFRTLVDDLALATDEELLSRAMTAIGRLVLLFLKWARSAEQMLARVWGWRPLFQEVRIGPNSEAALARLWRYAFSAFDAPEERVLSALAAVLKQEEKQDMASVADQLVARGERKGIEKGIEQGIDKGVRNVLVRQLERRFGPLPGPVRERIEQAAAAELELWVDRVLTAATLGEVLDGNP